VGALTVWRYGTPLGVDAAELRMKILQERGALTVHDYVVVRWPDGADAPTVRHPRGTGRSAGVGAFLGVALGGLLAVPVAGLALGAAAGAAASRLREAGVDDDFVASVRESLTPGTSALVVLSSDADVAEVRQMLARDRDVTVIVGWVDDDARAKLEQALHDEERG
jgi:uncharacterized membrane protein